MTIKKEKITGGARKKRKLLKSNVPILPIDPLAIVGAPAFDLPPEVYPSRISPVKPMPKLEKPPPFDLEKALEEDNESEDSFEAFMRLPLPQKKKKSQNKKKPKPKKKKHNFDMFEERPKKGKTPRKKRKLKRMSKPEMSQLDYLLGLNKQGGVKRQKV